MASLAPTNYRMQWETFGCLRSHTPVLISPLAWHTRMKGSFFGHHLPPRFVGSSICNRVHGTSSPDRLWVYLPLMSTLAGISKNTETYQGLGQTTFVYTITRFVANWPERHCISMGRPFGAHKHKQRADTSTRIWDRFDLILTLKTLTRRRPATAFLPILSPQRIDDFVTWLSWQYRRRPPWPNVKLAASFKNSPEFWFI